MIYKGYKYRIYPNQAQRVMIDRTIAACRQVYNIALELKMHAYKQHQIRLSAFDLCYQLPDLKEGFPWIGTVDSQALKAAVTGVDVAFKNFFNGKGYPNFKSKRSHNSFQCPSNLRRINWDAKTLDIPKIYGIPIRLCRPFEGKIKTVTISKTSTGKYFASILVEQDLQVPELVQLNPDTTIGIDLGIKDFCIFDNGTRIANPRFLDSDIKRLKTLQRRAARKKKGSKNRKKAFMRVARQHEKIANRRRDFQHKLSTFIVTGENQAISGICLESLRVGNMLKNRNLAKSISDVGWSSFVNMLQYKCKQRGINLVRIGTFEASSKACHVCGVKNDVLSLADREWTCANCNVTHDRDVNAAKNIRLMGLQQHSGRGTPEEPVEPPALAGAMKQEAVTTNSKWLVGI